MQTNTKPEELSNIQNSTEANNKENSFKADIEKIEDTVFGIANNPEHGWFITIGPNRVTNMYPTREEAMAQLEHPTEKWNIIFHMVMIGAEAVLRVEKEERGER